MSHPLVTCRLPSTDEGAFTLLELLVVAALVAIMLTLSVPAFRTSLLNDPLRQGTRKVIGTINEARQAATRSTNGCFVNLNISENELGYHCPGSAAEDSVDNNSSEKEPTRGVKLPDQIRISSVWIGVETSISTGEVDLWINHQGLMTQTIINLTDEDKEMSLISSVFVADIRLEDTSMSPEDLGQVQ